MKVSQPREEASRGWQPSQASGRLGGRRKTDKRAFRSLHGGLLETGIGCKILAAAGPRGGCVKRSVSSACGTKPRVVRSAANLTEFPIPSEDLWMQGRGLVDVVQHDFVTILP